jgi:hypothetical protein
VKLVILPLALGELQDAAAFYSARRMPSLACVLRRLIELQVAFW